MPIYLWKCEHCQVLTQVIRKVKDIEVPPGEPDDDKVVTECNKASPVQNGQLCATQEHAWVRIPASTTFQLVGKGWYQSGGY